MAGQQYPVDAIGNQIRKGNLLRVSLPESALIFTVADVEPAGVLNAPDGSPMNLQGRIMLVVQLPIPYVGGSRIDNMLVLQTPEQEAGLKQ